MTAAAACCPAWTRWGTALLRLKTGTTARLPAAPLYPPEYGKVLTGAVSLDEVRQALQSYHYSVCYAVTAEPGTQGKGGSEDVE